MPHYTYLIIGGGMTGDAATPRHPRGRSRRLHRPHRQRGASALQPPAPLQGALERQTSGEHLAQGPTNKG